MTKAKTADTQDQPKAFTDVGELVKGIDLLKALIKPVEDLKREGNPYRDAERAKTEFQIKDAIRDIFGEDSVEYQQYKNFRLKASTKTELNQALVLLQGLIDYLGDKKLELEGKKPKAAPKLAAAEKPAPVPPPPSPPIVPKPVIVPASPPPPPPIVAAPPPPPPVRLSLPPIPVAVAPPAPSPVFVAPAPSPPSIPDDAPPSPPTIVEAPPPSPPKPAARPVVKSSPPPAPEPAVEPAAASSKSDIIALLRKIGTRFHAVARQLRLRYEERTTLDIEDEYDAQDVVHALLCLEFDDISLETWFPDYAKGASRTDFMLPRDKIVIEVKKTRHGLSAKELTSQIDADVQYYWTHPDCQTLFCFVYDPDGRLGDPHKLEKKLTREIDGKKLEVLISPK